MFNVLYEKIKQDEANSGTEREVSALEDLEKMLVQTKTVMDLLFMNEVSQLMTLCSKQFQCFDVLPFETMHAFNCLIKNLHVARESFLGKKPPKTIKIVFPSSKTLNCWEFFQLSTNKICESQTFKGVPLLLPGEKGRVTRSGTVYGYDKQAYMVLVHNRFQKYTDYLGELIDSLKQRFLHMCVQKILYKYI